MRERVVNIPVIVSSLETHSVIKHAILELINSSTNTVKICEGFDIINKTDWGIDNDNFQEYQNFIKPYLIDHISEIFKKYNSLGLRFGNFWFQQYESNDIHDWHVHGLCHFTHIYFLELPDISIKTEIKDFFGNIIQYEAKEGDILSFPSCLYHRSPLNTANKRKTIISFNTNFL